MGRYGGRGDILDENGLRFARREVQRTFWSAYNLRGRRTPARLGEIAGPLLDPERVARAARLERVRQAWSRVAPEAFARQAEVEALRGGVLVIGVAGAAARFVLSRQIGDTLLAAMRELLPDQRLERIEWRTGGAGGRAQGTGRD